MGIPANAVRKKRLEKERGMIRSRFKTKFI